ncbi:hypothetical protein KHA80_14235 [Anaerobacillus sp. HL2]|nr:hypothetical protein KHA80_14235 [Anaerobacillus sp. HL2]
MAAKLIREEWLVVQIEALNKLGSLPGMLNIKEQVTQIIQFQKYLG